MDAIVAEGLEKRYQDVQALEKRVKALEDANAKLKQTKAYLKGLKFQLLRQSQ